MRKIIKEFNIYTIDELKEANPDGYKKAIIKEIEFLQEDFFNFTFDFDYKPVIEKIEELFNASSSWECDGYNASYYIYDCAGEEISTYKRTYSFVYNKILPQIKSTDCPLTGCYTDTEPLNIINKFIKGEVIYNDVKSLVNDLGLAVLKSANNEYQQIGEDINYIIDNINANEYTFLIDGTMYNI